MAGRIYKILVTGGAGFIGSNLVDKLLKEGHEVIVLDNFVTGRRENVNKQARIYELDVCDPELSRVFRRENFDIVYHLAGESDLNKSMFNPFEDCNNNVLGSINVAKNCGEYGVKKLIFSSTVNIYKNENMMVNEGSEIEPLAFNALSKRVSELYIMKLAEEYGFKYSILRYSDVYGVRQGNYGDGGVIKLCIEKLKTRSLPMIFGEEYLKRDFIFVIDVVEANVKALELGDNQIYNIASGVAVEQGDVLKMIIEKFNPHAKLYKCDMRKGEKYYPYIDITKAKSELDWSPIFSIEDGIEITTQYEKQCV